MRNQTKCYAIAAAAFLVAALVLVLAQSVNQPASAVSIVGLPKYDDCSLSVPQPASPTSMNSIRRLDIVKTIFAQKEIFDCDADFGKVTAEVTTYLEIYENIDDMQILDGSVLATVCLKQQIPPQVLDCESYVPAETPPFIGGNVECTEQVIADPQQMNTIRKGAIAKTIEAQKEVVVCTLLGDGTIKKIDIIFFTDIYEDLSTQRILDVQFLAAECLVLVNDNGERRDATVESCRFTQIAD